MKQLSTFLLIALIATLQPAIAQENDSKGKHFGGYGYFLSGYQMMDLSSMNDLLVGKGYPELQNGSVSIGGGGYYLLNNWHIGGEGYGVPGSSAENASYKVNHGGGYGFLNVGYLVWKTPGFMLMPVVGVGGGGITVTLREKAATTPTFEQILDDPGREVQLNNGGFMLNFSVMAHYLVLGTKQPDVSGGFILGLKAGYILNLDGDNWYLDDQVVSQTPASSVSGPYFTLVLGGGGSGRK
jgi:hypothetical protein